MQNIILTLLFFTLVLFSSCITAFQTQQVATTLPPATLEINGTVGLGEFGLGMRYGVTKFLDIGAYWRLNKYLNSEPGALSMYAADVKINLIANKYFAVATGAGIDMGSDFLRRMIYIQATIPDEEAIHADPWYASKCNDILIPLYLTVHLDSNFSFYINPFYVYRYDVRNINNIVNDGNVNEFYPGCASGISIDLPKKNLRLQGGCTYLKYAVEDVQMISGGGIMNPETFDASFYSFIVSINAAWNFDLGRKQ
ncbi:MAG: hypothetical protein ACHQFW_03045 [Chitinophagales bacterium]